MVWQYELRWIMSIYIFYDTDCNGEEEYDISGEDYTTLIKTCCKYCNTLSLRITHPDTDFANVLDKFAVNKNNEKNIAYQHYYGTNMDLNHISEIRYYEVCEELKEILLLASNSIFKWIYGWGYTNPEDPVFYRPDGSVFFYSIVHEGKCVLIPQVDEDVDSIILNEHWLRCEGTETQGDGSSVFDD